MIKELKQLVQDTVEINKDEIIRIEKYIHENPEYAYEEFKACDILVNYMESQGFEVEKGICKIPTAFKATYKGTKEGYNIGILGEYDAFRGLGHACGHNLMAGMAVGAGVALKQVIDKIGGSVTVFGTPAEESGGAKVLMVERGAFKDIDAAMTLHAANETVVKDVSISKTDLEIHFYKKDAKDVVEKTPKENIDIITEIIELINKVGDKKVEAVDPKLVGMSLRGIENTKEDHYSARFRVRAFEKKTKNEILEDLYKLCNLIGEATNTRFEHNIAIEYGHPHNPYEDIRNNETIEELLKKNFIDLGEEVKPRDSLTSIGCTDVGNVTHEIPALQSYIKVCENLRVHTPEFVEACGDERGARAVIVGAKAMAMTAVDLLCSKDNMESVKKDFQHMKERFQ